MSRRISAVLGIPALVALLSISAGCATTKQLDEVRAIAEEAKVTASEALSVANEANQRSMATDQKIDEMFKKAMMK